MGGCEWVGVGGWVWVGGFRWLGHLICGALLHSDEEPPRIRILLRILLRILVRAVRVIIVRCDVLERVGPVHSKLRTEARWP